MPPEPVDWTLPKQWGQWWELVTETADPGRETEVLESSQTTPVAGRSVMVLRRRETAD